MTVPQKFCANCGREPIRSAPWLCTRCIVMGVQKLELEGLRQECLDRYDRRRGG